MAEVCKVSVFQNGEKIREWWGMLPVEGCFSISLSIPMERDGTQGAWSDFTITMDDDDKKCSHFFVNLIAADTAMSLQLLQTGMLRLQTELICFEAESKWLECTYVCHCNEMGKVIGITGSQVSYARSLLNEQQVLVQPPKKIQEHLMWERKLFIAGPVILFRRKADQKGTVEYISPNIGQFGYRQEDVMFGAKSYFSFIHAEDMAQVNEKISIFNESGEPFFQHYYRIVRADGKIRWVGEFTSASWDERGNITHYDGYIFDITDVKLMESILRESEELFSKAFHLSPALMFISLAEDGRVIEINDTALRVLNVSRAEMIGSSQAVMDWMFCDAREYENLINQDHQGEVVLNIEREYCDKEGNQRIGLFSIEKVEIGDQKCVLTVVSDITERKQGEKLIHFQAYHDLLTELPNRRKFEEHLTLALSRPGKEAFAVIFIDLDGFKKVNDTLGHLAGDRLLKDVAARLAYTVREGDVVARLGGDEFMLLLFDVRGPSEVEPIASRILDVCSQPFNLQGQVASVTASVGINFFPEDGLDGDTLMKNADIAMYKAKELGRNQIAYYHGDMKSAAEKSQGDQHA